MMSSDKPSKVLGIIQLANRPLSWRGAVGNPDTFRYPTLYDTADGAFAEGVARADPALASAYIEAARRLKARGASLIIASCGFAAVYQAAIRRAVQMPVAASSLLQLPFLAANLAPDKKIDILTFDEARLNSAYLDRAGLASYSDQIFVSGIRGTQSWTALSSPDPCLDQASLWADVEGLLEPLKGDSTDIGAVLLECSAYCLFADRIRDMTGLPTFDLVSLADYMMLSLGWEPVPGRPRF